MSYMNLVYGPARHITLTLVQPSHISVIPYWEVNFDWFSKNPSIGTELYASVHTHLTIKSVIVEERPIKISLERLKRVENIHCLK